MKREDSNAEDLENGRTFVRSLLQPPRSDAGPALQERVREAALNGLTKAMGTLARYDLSLEEMDNTLIIYRRAWRTLDSVDITDPGTPEKLIQIALEIKTAQDDLITALLLELQKKHITLYLSPRRT